MISREILKLKTLIKLLKDMYRIISSNSNNDVNYAKKNIIKMVEYLEEELVNDKIKYKEIIYAVNKSYKSMFPPRGGLSEFNIWHNDYETRYNANHEFENIKEQIETILNSDK